MSIIVNGVELTEVIYAGVNLDIVKVKKGAAEAVTVFEKITQLATPQNVTANGTTVSWDAVENSTSYAVLADGASIGTVTPSYKVTVTIDETSSYGRKEFIVCDGGQNGKVLYSNTSSSGSVPSPQTFDITSGQITFNIKGTFMKVTPSNIIGLQLNEAASSNIGDTHERNSFVYDVLSNGSISIAIDYDY